MKWNQEVDRAIVSEVPEEEIRQIKKQYIADRIKSSIDAYGNKPELFGHIIGTAITALALLISKVLSAARELKNKIFQEKLAEMYPSKQETVSELSGRLDTTISEINTATEPVTQVPKPVEPQIPPRPNMPADAKAYPKLSRIYGELNQQNSIIFETEKVRNSLEDQRDELKGYHLEMDESY